MSPIGSYVSSLTSKGQVGVLLGEHRGWILRMAALIKGRLSDNRPEAFAASFQTSEGEHQHAFLFPNIQHSTSPTSQRLADSRQRLVSNACKSLMSYIWQAGVATMSCCHGIQIFYLRNSLNFHKNGILVRIKA